MQALLYSSFDDVHNDILATSIIKGFDNEPEIICRKFQYKPNNGDFTSAWT